MDLNLLPEQKRKIIKQEYFLRFFTVFSVFMIAIVVTCIILLLPSYYVTIRNETLLKNDVKALDKPVDEGEVTLKRQAKEADAYVEILSKSGPKHDPSFYFDRVFSLKNSGIRIDSFSYNEKSIYVRGISSSREDLITFSDFIKADDFFKSVDLPISSFAKNQDISFALTIGISQ